MLSLFLYLLASLGTIGMGLRYIRVKPPLDYHAAMTRDEKPGEITIAVFGALYKVLGGGYLAAGVMFLMLTIFGVWHDILWAKLTILAGTLAAGWFSTSVPFKMEKATGVKTPWRLSGGMTVVMLLAIAGSFL